MMRATYKGHDRNGNVVRHTEACPDHARPLLTVRIDGVRCELESLVRAPVVSGANESAEWLRVASGIPS